MANPANFARHNQAFNSDSLQRGICFANFTPRCKPLRRQAGSVLPVNLALVPLKNPFIQAHAYSNGIQFLKRCAALGFPFLWASPVGLVSVYGLFGLWPLCSKRKQLLFW